MNPHICLLPGLDGSGDLFKPLLAELGDCFDTTVIRYRESSTFEETVAEAESQIPDVDTVSLVAESFSGLVATVILAKRKRNFGPSVFSATFARTPFQSLTKLVSWLPERAFQVGAANRLALELFGLDSEAPEALVNQAAAVLESADKAALKARIGILSKIDVSDQLRMVDVPVLYIRAKRDRIVSRKRGEEMVKYLPNVRVTEIDGPHLILQAEPALAAQAIVAHVTPNQSKQCAPTAPDQPAAGRCSRRYRAKR